MSKHDSTPKFPSSYLGNNSLDYDSSIWMERNQKKTTLLCLQYLYDKRLDNLEKPDFLKDEPSFILDLGCGTGFSTEILVERGFRVVGIDVLHDMLSKVKPKKNLMTNQNNLELILADINYIPLRNSSIPLFFIFRKFFTCAPPWFAFKTTSLLQVSNSSQSQQPSNPFF